MKLQSYIITTRNQYSQNMSCYKQIYTHLLTYTTTRTKTIILLLLHHLMSSFPRNYTTTPDLSGKSLHLFPVPISEFKYSPIMLPVIVFSKIPKDLLSCDRNYRNLNNISDERWLNFAGI